jgi:hypothetical protein
VSKRNSENFSRSDGTFRAIRKAERG